MKKRLDLEPTAKMELKKLFNPDGDDSLQERSIIGGNTTNLFNLNNVKYTWANKLYRAMMENFWIPEKIVLKNDQVDYDKMTKHEQRAFNGILSFLVFLDSIQTNNLPNISDLITAPEVNLCLAVQTYQEAVHSQSYAYIIESVIPKTGRDQIYEFWRKDKQLFDRNSLIAKVYQNFIDNKTNENFGKMVIADFIMEGIYFYNGFNFFYNLASRNLMIGTKDIIKLIHRDESTHKVLFANIISTIRAESPGIINDEDVYSMTKEAVESEIAWANHIIGDEILGMNSKSIEQYTKWLANQNLKKIGLKELYLEALDSPFLHLEKIADTEAKGDSKSNFFEANVTSYVQSSAIKGWENF
jgi:ribonucleoside-diphosphate reductase beta chain